jgi:ankyrin repeat protein
MERQYQVIHSSFSHGKQATLLIVSEKQKYSQIIEGIERMLSESETESSSSNDTEFLAICSVVADEEVSIVERCNQDELLVSSTTEEKDHESSLQNQLDAEKWSSVACLIEDLPSLAHAQLTIIIQGERISCRPLHAVCARRLPSLDLLEQLIAYSPSALRERDPRGRLPLHLALLRGCCSPNVIRYLCERSPFALLQKDDDGNVPLHYACQFASHGILQIVLNACPEAATIANNKKRMPLHFVCARNWDLEGPSVCSVREAFPEAALASDRSNRLPLHWACDQPLLRYDLLAALVEQYPGGLLHRDHTGATPVQLAKRMQKQFYGEEQSVVLAFLTERTVWERRNKCVLHNFFTIRMTSEKNKNNRQSPQFPYG